MSSILPKWKRCLTASGWIFTTLLLLSGCSRLGDGIDRREWVSMGTTAAIQVRGDAPADQVAETRAAVQDVFARVEHEFSRYDTNSVLRRTGDVSSFGRPCADAAAYLKMVTRGAFDVNWRAGTDPEKMGPVPNGGARNEAKCADYGAIAKGYAVDLAAEEAAKRGGDYDLLVDLGGTVKSVRGVWQTGIRDPNGTGVAAVVELRPGEALSTSAEYFRGKHIYDARTHKPVSNDVASVTVLFNSAMQADGLSTSFFVLGTKETQNLIRHTRVPTNTVFAVLMIRKDGSRVKHDPSGRLR